MKNLAKRFKLYILSMVDYIYYKWRLNMTTISFEFLFSQIILNIWRNSEQLILWFVFFIKYFSFYRRILIFLLFVLWVILEIITFRFADFVLKSLLMRGLWDCKKVFIFSNLICERMSLIVIKSKYIAIFMKRIYGAKIVGLIYYV